MNKKRKCRECKAFCDVSSGFVVPLGFFCSTDCAATYSMNALNKLRKIKLRKEKESLRDRSWYLKEAQTWFNKYIRFRDASQPCISCERHHTGQYHAGHYRSVGAAGHLRFNESNCHKQCSVCNNYKSGNIEHYRQGLIKKIGLKAVLDLENNNESVKFTIDQLKAIILEYKEKVKQIS